MIGIDTEQGKQPAPIYEREVQEMQINLEPYELLNITEGLQLFAEDISNVIYTTRHFEEVDADECKTFLIQYNDLIDSYISLSVETLKVVSEGLREIGEKLENQ